MSYISLAQPESSRYWAAVFLCLRKSGVEKGFERHLVRCSCLGPEYRNPFIQGGGGGLADEFIFVNQQLQIALLKDTENV